MKSECSQDELPLDPEVATILMKWKHLCPDTNGDWVFPSPRTNKPYDSGSLRKKALQNAASRAKIQGRFRLPTPSGFLQALCGVMAANPQPFGCSELIESLLAIIDLPIADASRSPFPSSKPSRLVTPRAIEPLTSVFTSAPPFLPRFTPRIA